MKLDTKKSYAAIYGHDHAAFQQNGELFDAKGEPIVPPDPKLKPAVPSIDADAVIETPEVTSAGAFLKNLLKEGPMAKSVIYNEAEKNNQLWENVQKAASLMNIQARPMGSGAKKVDTWSLARE